MQVTLLSDSSSDQALLPVLDWLLGQTDLSFRSQWADLRRLPRPPKKLEDRIVTALDMYPCDLLFVHRDAEKESLTKRVDEIQRAGSGIKIPVVCVIPVRMQEAWFLFDQAVIRRAAGNPYGTMPLNLPSISRVESLPDPKQVLYTALRCASGLSGRKARKFRPSVCVHRLTELVTDWSPLNSLSDFNKLKDDMRSALKILGIASA